MSTLARGQRVDRYELVQVLGEGGMGTVWLAHPHDAPDQLLAVKMVLEEHAADPRVCAMFVKEATLAASIDHPNVVRLYDVGLHDDVPFFVMEWIDGYSLRDVARTVADSGHRVPPAIALRIASDLCGGLHAAHELRGEDGTPLELVHRDVSPHNVLVTRDGVAKLIDFGVAKARDLTTGSEQSVVGGIKGKVRYMAPEQALEKALDRRADLFSVGAITYQLLTGRAPFEAATELAIINALLSTNPVFVPNDLPEPVQWILRRALARRPENRFADAREMQDAIELALVELGEPDRHSDVAECLAWFDPLRDDHEVGSHAQSRAASAPPEAETQRRPPPVSQPPPSNTFGMRGASIPVRYSPLPDDPLEIARRKHKRAEDAGSLRFVLLAAGFVGVLGIGAAFLVKDTPSRTRESVEAPIPEPVPAPPPATVPPKSVSTPIVDIGDVDRDPGGKKGAKRTLPSSSPSTSTSRPTGTSGGGKAGDLAGPVKVWK